jgi:hypothetical protein
MAVVSLSGRRRPAHDTAPVAWCATYAARSVARLVVAVEVEVG